MPDILKIKVEKTKEVASTQSYQYRQMRHQIAVLVPEKPEVGYLRHLQTFFCGNTGGITRENAVLNSNVSSSRRLPYDKGNNLPKN